MTTDAASLAVILAIMGGYHARKLWQARDDVRGLKTRLANARRVFRRVLAVSALVGAAIYAAAYHWVHIHGG